MKILITGFAPFGGEAVNPSQMAVEALAAPCGMTLCKAILPVTWSGAVPTLMAAVQSCSPDAVIMTGLAGGSDAIRVERIGINLCGALPDAEGKFPTESKTECKIEPDGPDAYFTTYDDHKILSALRAADIPARASFSAGTYLCNCVLYSMLSYAHGKGIRAGFLHIPYAAEMKKDAPSLPLDTIIEALTVAITNI